MSKLHRYRWQSERLADETVEAEQQLLPFAGTKASAQQRRHAAVCEAAEGMGVPLIEVWYDRTIGQRITTLIGELPDEAIVVLPGRSDTQWWQRMAHAADVICLLFGRLAVGDHRGSAPFPSHAIYIGPRRELFRVAFGRLGKCIVGVEVRDGVIVNRRTGELVAA